jgi:hypothetical protein
VESLVAVATHELNADSYSENYLSSDSRVNGSSVANTSCGDNEVGVELSCDATSTANARMAVKCAFLDAMSPLWFQ